MFGALSMSNFRLLPRNKFIAVFCYGTASGEIATKLFFHTFNHCDHLTSFKRI